MSNFVWAIPLLLLVFLFELNDRLRGAFKETIAGVLALSILGVCGSAFYFSGWRTGCVLLVAAFVLGAAFYRPTVWIARKLTKYPDLCVDEYSRKRHARLLRDWRSEKWWRGGEKQEEKKQRHMSRSVDMALDHSQVKEVLERHHATRPDLEAMYRRVEIWSLPPKLRELALCNPRMIEYFLTNSVPANVKGEYVRNLNSMDASLRFGAWARHYPDGDDQR